MKTRIAERIEAARLRAVVKVKKELDPGGTILRVVLAGAVDRVGKIAVWEFRELRWPGGCIRPPWRRVKKIMDQSGKFVRSGRGVYLLKEWTGPTREDPRMPDTWEGTRF